MTGTEITYDEDGYALTPQGQAWKLWVSGEEPATQADRDWFEAFNSEARQEPDPGRDRSRGRTHRPGEPRNPLDGQP